MPRKWLALGAGGLAALIVAFGFIWQARVINERARRMAEMEKENRRLSEQLAAAKHAATPAPAVPQAGAPVHMEPRARGGPGTEEYITEIHAAEQLRQKLAQANASIEQLGLRVAQLETEVQKLNVDNKRLTDSEADLNDNLSAANRAISALQAELKTKSDRMVQVEVADQKLRDQRKADQQKLSQYTDLVTQLQAIERRRDNYLSGILRRYKDLTEQYRELTGVFDNRRADFPGAGSADLSRIQNSISMAEDDLRQLAGLNAQAQRIQRQIAGK